MVDIQDLTTRNDDSASGNTSTAGVEDGYNGARDRVISRSPGLVHVLGGNDLARNDAVGLRWMCNRSGLYPQ